MTVLAERRRLLFGMLGLLYSAQGLIQAFLGVVVAAWLTRQGWTQATLGEVTAIGFLPWVLKLGWAPLVDRHSRHPMGARKPWLLVALFGAAMAMGTLALVQDPIGHPMTLAWLMAGVFVFVSLGDVCIDGMAVDLAAPEDHSKATASMFVGALLGAMVGALVMSGVFAQLGYHASLWVVSATLALLATPLLFVRERAGDARWAWRRATSSPPPMPPQPLLMRALLARLLAPASLAFLSLLVGMRVVAGLLEVVLKVLLLQKLGWGEEAYAQTMGGAAGAGVLLGAALAVALTRKLGDVRTGALGLLGVAACVLTFGWGEAWWPERWFVIGVQVGSSAATIVATVAIGSLGMKLAQGRFAATQFALYMAALNLGMALGARAAGWVEAVATDTVFLTCGVALTLLALAYARLPSPAEPTSATTA